MKERTTFNLPDAIKRLAKSWLLPYPFKMVGFALLVAVILLLVADFGFNISKSTDSASTLPVLQRVQMIMLYVAMFFLSCSREREEDEMTAALRGETLKEVCYIAFVVWVAYRVVMACSSQSIAYIVHDEEVVTPFIVWALYYARFENKLKRLRRESRKFSL